MPHADTFEILGIEDIVLVAFITAGLGLASGARCLGACPGVCLWVDECEVRITALKLTGGASGWSGDNGMLSLTGMLSGPFGASDRHGSLAPCILITPASGDVGLFLDTTHMMARD